MRPGILPSAALFHGSLAEAGQDVLLAYQEQHHNRDNAHEGGRHNFIVHQDFVGRIGDEHFAQRDGNRTQRVGGDNHLRPEIAVPSVDQRNDRDGDEGGLFVGQRNTAAEGAVEGVNTAAAPGNLDGAVKKCKNEPLYGLHPYIYCVLHVYYSILLVWMQIAERGDRGDFRMGIYNLKPPLITAQ